MLSVSLKMALGNIHIAWKEEAASYSHCIHCDGVLLTSNNGTVRL